MSASIMLDDPQFLEIQPTAFALPLEQLQRRERVWFAWVCRLHDVHSGMQTAHSAAVLAVARRRWAEARRALQREAKKRPADRSAEPSRPR